MFEKDGVVLALLYDNGETADIITHLDEEPNDTA